MQNVGGYARAANYPAKCKINKHHLSFDRDPEQEARDKPRQHFLYQNLKKTTVA